MGIAYNTPSGQYIHGDTLYLAGRGNIRDWYDDITKIPTMTIQHSQKYNDVEKLLNSSAGGGITRIIGHSLGGIVSEKIQEKHPEINYNTTTYAGPDISVYNKSNVTRYRNAGDIVSILDGAKIVGSSFNPLEAHSYSNSEYTSGDTEGRIIGRFNQF